MTLALLIGLGAQIGAFGAKIRSSYVCKCLISLMSDYFGCRPAALITGAILQRAD
jgi:hypothetical protein